MASNYISLPPEAGGSGAVDSVNGLTGVVVLTKSNIGLGNVDNTSDANKPISTATQTALDAKQATIDGTVGNNSILGTDGSGNVIQAPNLTLNSDGGVNQSIQFEPDDETGTASLNNNNVNIEPLQDSPDETVNLVNLSANLDNNDSGFDQGTSGQAVRFISTNASHQGSGDIGEIQYISNNSNLGNGTDPINVRGIGFAYGFGTVNANVNLNGPLQGYGMQLSVNAAATINSSQYIAAFYDTNNIACAAPSYQSVNLSPTLASINNNNSYIGVNLFPTISNFTGNAGFIGLSVSGNLGTFNNNGYFQGVNVNPNITSARYAAGLQVSMDNVTPYAGVASSLTEQDIEFEFTSPADNNNYTLEYTSGATAGSEVVSIVGTDITVQIEDGVSTATQIKAAWDAVPTLSAAITATIVGTASNPQDIFGPTNFSGGVNAGSVKAAYLDGDVEITGNLTFGGALSIGKLNAFASQAIVDSGGTPASIHGLVSNPTVAANATIANADTLGINTAMLLTIGDNATVTTAFTGIAALALPAVVNMGAGSTVDQVSGGTFAISLDAAAGGGTIGNLDLCRSIAIPNGSTTITSLRGYTFDLPFGDPGTTTWGFYASPNCNNYFQGNLLIGGTAGSDDTVTNSSVALEIKSTTKAFVASRMSSAERDALTAIDGMVLYNSTTNKLQVRASGAWVDLH